MLPALRLVLAALAGGVAAASSPPTVALRAPWEARVDSGGRLWAAGWDVRAGSGAVLRSAAGGVVEATRGLGWTVTREPRGLPGPLKRPRGLALVDGGALVTSPHGVWRVDAESGFARVVAGGTGRGGFADALNGLDARFAWPCAAIADAAQTRLFVADFLNDRVRVVRLDDGGLHAVSTLVGGSPRGHVDGPLASARLNAPRALALDDEAGVLYVVEAGHAARRRRERAVGVPRDVDDAGQRVRAVRLAEGVVSTVAGGSSAGFSDVPGALRFSGPRGAALGGGGATLYVADEGNARIRALDLRAEPVTARTVARLDAPRGVALDADGESLVVADVGRGAILRVPLVGGARTTTLLDGTAGVVEASFLSEEALSVLFVAGAVCVAFLIGRAFRRARGRSMMSGPFKARAVASRRSLAAG